MFDSRGRFIIEDYNQKPAFSSFLPGISGIYGIPLWCFYTNRGQAVASFGVENKNHYGILSGPSGLPACEAHGVSYLYKDRE